MRISKEQDNIDEVTKIKEMFSLNKIKLFKYNYSMDQTMQNMPSYEGFLQLSENGKYLSIFTFKPKQTDKEDDNENVKKSLKEEFYRNRKNSYKKN